jgi:hypothetical protein
MSRPAVSATVRAAVATGSALLAVAAVVADVGSPLQPALVFWFVLVCPGMPYVGLVRTASPSFAVAMSIAISCALAVVVSQAMLFAGVWNPLLGLIGLAELTVLGAVVDVGLDRRARRLAVDDRRRERR